MVFYIMWDLVSGLTLADCRPEQVKAKITSNEGPHMLSFKVGDIITVLDKK